MFMFSLMKFPPTHILFTTVLHNKPLLESRKQRPAEHDDIKVVQKNQQQYKNIYFESH